MLKISEHDNIYWQYEYDVVAKHLVPLLTEWGLNSKSKTLLDVGCGDGGGVSAFYDAGFVCKGFDIETRRVELANAMRATRDFEMVYGNIYDENFPYSKEHFDLIVLHDVFEHLEKKESVLEKLKSCLKSDGRILITFPPYYSAYGAHQQLLKSKMGKFPFFHLLPFSIPFLIDKFPNEEKLFVEEIKKLASLKMGIRKFEKLSNSSGLSIEKVKKYIIGPNHIRFGLQPVSAGWFGKFPILNELISSGVIYLFKK